MSNKALITNRELKNKVTGIDLHVSDYQEIPHRSADTFLYHVIVITNLFYYKSRSLRESDVVQFMVSKTFDEFADFYQKLYKRFPSVNFPQLPGNSLILSDSETKFNCVKDVLALVACTQKLCCSPMVIKFLRETMDTKNDSNKNKKRIKEKYVALEDEIVNIDADEEFMVEVDLFARKQSTTQLDEREENVPELSDTEVVVASSKLPVVDAENNKLSLANDNKESQDHGLFENQSQEPIKSETIQKFNNMLDEDDDDDDIVALTKMSAKRNIKVLAVKPSVKPGVGRRSPVKHQTSLHEHIRETQGEKMFKRSLSTNSRKIRTDQDGNLDDIFGKLKKASIFDDDDDSTLFSPSKSKSSRNHPKGSVDIDITEALFTSEHLTKENEHTVFSEPSKDVSCHVYEKDVEEEGTALLRAEVELSESIDSKSKQDVHEVCEEQSLIESHKGNDDEDIPYTSYRAKEECDTMKESDDRSNIEEEETSFQKDSNVLDEHVSFSARTDHDNVSSFTGDSENNSFIVEGLDKLNIYTHSSSEVSRDEQDPSASSKCSLSDDGEPFMTNEIENEECVGPEVSPRSSTLDDNKTNEAGNDFLLTNETLISNDAQLTVGVKEATDCLSTSICDDLEEVEKDKTDNVSKDDNAKDSIEEKSIAQDTEEVNLDFHINVNF